MNKIKLNWKYGLTVLLLATACACSENDDLAQLANKQEQEGTRTADWYTKEVTLETIGTLEAKVTEAMAGEELSKLEKLVVSGPMAAADFNYLRNNLSGLYSIDLKDVQIKESNEYYQHNGWRQLKNDTVCDYMFSHLSSLREFVLPSTTQYIDRYAFASCDSLTSIVIPEGVKVLNDETFRYCRSLASVTLPANLESIGRSAFYYCDSLKSVVIPDKVKFLGHGAFEGCSSLASIEISSSSELDSIAPWVFYNNKIKTINIPDQVRKIGNYAFYHCQSLSSIKLPSNLDCLESDVFRECKSLKSIVIPDKVKYIGEWAFWYCDSLSSVEFSSSSLLDSIAYRAFYSTDLRTIVLPDKVKIIGNEAFRHCDSLTIVKMPSNLEFIGDYAFANCGLTSVVLPSTLKTISQRGFEGCHSLNSIYIPSGVEYIGVNAFYDCTNLTELTIPETVTTVEEGFASYCDNMQFIFWNASIDVPSCWGNAINGLLYVNTDQEISVNECWKNVILNGVAQSIITIQANNNNDFKIPKDFTAPEVVYTRHFGNGTVPGGSAGWETIVLPFTPDSIYHETKGQIAPFNSTIEGAKPFWLRELTADGFVDVTSMTPDKAYIIAMPNSSDYMDEYNLGGNITFTAKNVTIGKTPEVLEASVGPKFELHPSYNFIKKSLSIYTLGSKHGNYDNMWYSKSFFMRSADDVRAFNAYATALGGGRSSRAEFDLDTRSEATRGVPYKPNTSGIPQIGDM